MQVTFPFQFLRQDSRFWLEGMSLEPARSVSGVETVTPTMRGRWMATCNIVMKGEAATLEWQAFLAQMEGRVGTTLVPVHSRHRPKDRDGHFTPFCDTAGLADGQLWEHFGFEVAPIPRMTVSASAPLRATQIDVTIIDTTGIRPGQFFSIGERLYRVQAHWQPSATVTRLMFQPPLRAAVTAGTAVEIDRPVCRMRFASEGEGVFDQSLAVLPGAAVNFMEAI